MHHMIKLYLGAVMFLQLLHTFGYSEVYEIMT